MYPLCCFSLYLRTRRACSYMYVAAYIYDDVSMRWMSQLRRPETQTEVLETTSSHENIYLERKSDALTR